MLIGEAHLELSMLPDADQREGMLLELIARGGELGARLGALEQRASQQVLKAFDACRNGRLRDVHLARGIDEAAGFRNHQERAREIDIHRASSIETTCRDLSIEISDSGHRKIPFVAGLDSNHIGQVPAESNPIRLYLLGVTMEGRITMKAKKKPAKKAAAKKPAKKKKR